MNASRAAGIDQWCALAKLNQQLRTQRDFVESLIILRAPAQLRLQAAEEAIAIDDEIMALALSYQWPNGWLQREAAFSRLKPDRGQAPNADPRTLQFVVDFCQRELSEFHLLAIYLIGSRAKELPKPNADHDFVAVLEDTAPDDLCTAKAAHMSLLKRLWGSASALRLGDIDLMVHRKTHHFREWASPSSFPHSVVTGGIRLV